MDKYKVSYMDTDGEVLTMEIERKGLKRKLLEKQRYNVKGC